MRRMRRSQLARPSQRGPQRTPRLRRPRPRPRDILISPTGIAHLSGCHHLPEYPWLTPPKWGWVSDPRWDPDRKRTRSARDRGQPRTGRHPTMHRLRPGRYRAQARGSMLGCEATSAHVQTREVTPPSPLAHPHGLPLPVPVPYNLGSQRRRARSDPRIGYSNPPARC